MPSRIRAGSSAYRGRILHFLRRPEPEEKGPGAWEYWEDGLLWVEGGLVRAAGPAAELGPRLPKGIRTLRTPGGLLLPGFVDCHIHFPQVSAIASYGSQLLEWLERYIFPAEAEFRDPARARPAAGRFLEELLRNGTTTALVFASSHPESVEALFREALRRGMRLAAGKVLMDRNAPAELLDRDGETIPVTERLIRRWHGKGRLLYALTPRFAPTSSERQLEEVGRLRSAFPDVLLQTHLSENPKEVEWTRSLFPWAGDYLGVYERYGLVGPKSVFAHCIHLSPGEWDRLGAGGSAAAFCPTSNLFLGSGLLDLRPPLLRGVRVGIGTDVGAGTSFSMLRTLGEAYKVAQLRGRSLSPWEAFYMATLGGAKALGLESRIGNFEPGKEADFLMLDLKATPLLARRTRSARTVGEKLFALMTLGDDRAVRAVYLLGKRAYSRPA